MTKERRLAQVMNFEKQLKKLSDAAVKKNVIADNAVSAVSRLLQSKYPELVAEYSISDGGIIFIDDSNMAEYYSLEHVYQVLGRR